MPPRVRGRGKGPMRGGPSGSAGPSHRRTPSESLSGSDSKDDLNLNYAPSRRSVSLRSSPSNSPYFELPIKSHYSSHSQGTHQSHNSLRSHSFHHTNSTYSPTHFNPNIHVNNSLGYNPLGPEDHFSQDMDVDDEPDPEFPIGTPGHPISISSGSPFQGSPYNGPDSFQERMAQYDWYFTPSYHNSPVQSPLDKPQLQADTPPPLPVEEPPRQPPEPPKNKRNARMSVRGGPRFTSPRGSSSYPPIPEQSQLGEPSHTVPTANHSPVSPTPLQPPLGFGNPIPTYPGSSGYNPSGYPSDYGTQDPYLTASQYHHLYPSSYPPVYPTGYPAQDYQYPPYQQPPLFQQQQTQEILQRLDRVEHEAHETKKKHNGFVKGLMNLLKSKKK